MKLNRARHPIPLVLLVLLSSLDPVKASSEIPEYNGLVNDQIGILTEQAKPIEELCHEIERETGVRVAILAVKNTNPLPPEQYAKRIFDLWGLRDYGRAVLVLLSYDDKNIWIVPGSKVKKSLPPERVSEILRVHLDPLFYSPGGKLYSAKEMEALLDNRDWQNTVSDVAKAISYSVSGGKYLFQPRIDPSPLTGLTQTFPPRDLFLLALQLAMLALTYLICRHLTLRWDTTRHKNFNLFSDRDPFDIAYLRGGGSEVLTLSIFNLIRRGYLEIIVKPGEVIRCGRTASTPRSGTLSELEHKLHEWFSTPHNAEQIHRLSIKLKNRWGHSKTWECSCGIKNKEGVKICSGCGSTLVASTMIATEEPEKKVLETQDTYAERLALERFLMPKGARDNTTYFIALLFFAIISVGVIGSLSISVSVFLGILLFGIGFIAIRSVCATPYLTRMGENCLEESIRKYSWCKEPQAKGPLSGDDESILFPVALFGVNILYHTKYSFFPKMFYYRNWGGGRDDGVRDPETGAFVPDEAHVVAENTPELRITGSRPTP